MDKEQHRAAKARLVAQMQAGRSWQAAAATAGMQISQSTAYRLLQVVRIRGEAALQDGRHGHPSKLHGEDVSELRTQEVTKRIGHFCPILLDVRPPAPWPKALPFGGETPHVGGQGKSVASWWSGPERTGALHQKRDKSVLLRPHFRTHASGSSVV
jgi:hypothetical protein